MQLVNEKQIGTTFAAYNQKEETNQHEQKIKHIADFSEEAVDILRNGVRTYGDTMPWDKTQDKFRLRDSEVTIWAGQNGSGKSLVLGQLAIHLGHTTRVGIASFEMPPVKTVHRMMVQALPDNPTDEIINEFNKQLDIHIYDHIGNLNEETVYGMCRYMAKEKGIKHIIIDSMVKCGINQSENEPQKRFMSKLQDIAKEYKVHIHIVMHLRKSERENDKPDKYSVKGGGELVDLADNAILLWRNKPKEEAKQTQKFKSLTEKETKLLEQPDCFMRIAKQRHDDYEGTIAFYFHQQRMQWIDNKNDTYHKYIDYTKSKDNKVVNLNNYPQY